MCEKRNKFTIHLSRVLLLVFLVWGFSQATSVFAAAASNFSVSISGTACYDGIDNDGDGKIDFPADPGCDSTLDTNETDVSGGGGGGGGGGVVIPSVSSVTFHGTAYPFSPVTLLQDGQFAERVLSKENAKFQITLSDIAPGNYIFALYSSDTVNRRSILLTFSVDILAGATTSISEVVIAPTIVLDKTAVKQGDGITVFAAATPNAKLSIRINSDDSSIATIFTGADGLYSHEFLTESLPRGKNFIEVQTALVGELGKSTFSRVLNFEVGDENILNTAPQGGFLRGDLSGDGRVNILDFSIAAYWYGQPLSEEFLEKELGRLNDDGVVDLADFSVIAFYWTG